MKSRYWLVFAVAAPLLGGCDASVKSTRRFQLPQGSVQNGQAAFVALKCTGCHTVAGVELPKPAVPAEAVVVLGGDVARVKTYGDLLTSIIHPDREVPEQMKLAPTPAAPRGKSPMPVVNDVMTVTQMVDLVTFLQPHYRQIPPPGDVYHQN